MIDVLIRSIQGEVSWCMLFADDVVMIDEMRVGGNERLEVFGGKPLNLRGSG